MTKNDLRAALSELKWSQSHFADVCGVHANTVTKWATGAAPVPKLATEYLRLLLRVKALLDQ